ncbi:hypothetical protein J6590_097441, partial [Homalodisca vitripennis]
MCSLDRFQLVNHLDWLLDCKKLERREIVVASELEGRQARGHSFMNCDIERDSCVRTRVMSNITVNIRVGRIQTRGNSFMNCNIERASCVRTRVMSNITGSIRVGRHPNK